MTNTVICGSTIEHYSPRRTMLVKRYSKGKISRGD